jgi:hypothetical protein
MLHTKGFPCEYVPMRVFEMKPDAESYRWLTTRKEEDFNLLSDLVEAPPGKKWTPVAVEWIDDDLNAGKPESDYPTLGTTPVVSQRAVGELLDALIENGEVLPLDNGSSADAYYVFNVTRSIDALDESRAEVVRFGTGRIMMVKRYAFLPGALVDVSIFRVPQLRVQVFVTERFVERVRRANLTGFLFREVWNSDSAVTSPGAAT